MLRRQDINKLISGTSSEIYHKYVAPKSKQQTKPNKGKRRTTTRRGLRSSLTTNLVLCFLYRFCNLYLCRINLILSNSIPSYIPEKALNPGVNLPAANIVVVHRSDRSGTTYVWTSYLSSQSPSWNHTVGASKSVPWPTGIGAPDNIGVPNAIKGSKDT